MISMIDDGHPAVIGQLASVGDFPSRHCLDGLTFSCVDRNPLFKDIKLRTGIESSTKSRYDSPVGYGKSQMPFKLRKSPLLHGFKDLSFSFHGMLKLHAGVKFSQHLLHLSLSAFQLA